MGIFESLGITKSDEGGEKILSSEGEVDVDTQIAAIEKRIDELNSRPELSQDEEDELRVIVPKLENLRQSKEPKTY